MEQNPSNKRRQHASYASSLKLSSIKNFANYRWLAFCLTFILYCFSHASRTVWGYTKPTMSKENPYYNSTMLGYLDTIFMLSYAFGQYMSGWLGDRMNLKLLILVGTLSATTGLSLFGYLQGFMKLESLPLAASLFVLNGFGQSTGYPGCVTIVSNWFTQKSGLVFGIWGISLYIGDIIGQQIGRLVVDEKGWDWQYALFITCGIFVFLALCLGLFVKVDPKDLSSKKEETQEEKLLLDILEADVGTGTNKKSRGHGQGINFFAACKIKYVPQFALSFFCIKGVVYGVLFWLPSYLRNDVKLMGDISIILASIEIGQIIGSISLGFASDRLKSKSIVITFGFFFAVIFLATTYLIQDFQSKSVYFILLLLAGFGIGGPGSLIGGAVASDLGHKLAEKDAVSAISTVVGIMEGCGALGAAITQIFISNFTSITFPFFAILCLIGGILMIPIALEDYRKQKRPANLLENDYFSD